jgi:pyruvate-formate lyase-activating enzyme
MLKEVSPKSVSILSGDPRPNPEFKHLPKALKDEFNCTVRLLTNGYVLPDLEGVSHVSMSIKAVNDDLHKNYTVKSNKVCLEHFKLIYNRGIELSASSVYIPGLIDKEEIESIAKFIATIDDEIPFRTIGYMKVNNLGYKEPSKEEVESIATLARKHLKNVVASRSSGEDYTGIVDLFTNNLRK